MVHLVVRRTGGMRLQKLTEVCVYHVCIMCGESVYHVKCMCISYVVHVRIMCNVCECMCTRIHADLDTNVLLF